MTCPRCGHIASHAFYINGWMIDPVMALIAYKGPAIDVPASWARLLVILAAENGAPVEATEIMQKLGWQSYAALKVQINHIRKFLASNGMPDPIASRRGLKGYRWAQVERVTV